MRRVLVLIISMVMVLSALICAAYTEGDVQIKSLTPADKKIVLAPNTTWQAEVTILPEDATDKKLQWKSSNEKVATVDENGLITGKMKGTCKITATTTDGSKRKTDITVQVKKYDLVLRYPTVVATYFDTTDDYAEFEVGFMGNVKRTIVQRVVTFKGDVVESAGERRIRPVKAGEGTVESIQKENGKATQKTKASVYVAKSAVTGEPVKDIINLSERKPIDASSEVAAYWKYQANDGKIDSYWESQGYPATLLVDLERRAEVSSIVVCLPSDWRARTQSIEVFVSEDRKEFTKIPDESEYKYDPKTGNRISILLPPTETRYVELEFIGGSWPNAQVAEITVYGTAIDSEETPVHD